MEDKYEDYFKVNKATWNKKVAVHMESEFYDVAAFKQGKSSLNAIEIDEVGNVEGKKLLHLQCHFGQDTLSWSRLGASCVGVDLSESGIEAARSLNAELKQEARFVVSNVYDVPKNIKETFDIVFTSYGVVGWLPDLDKWAGIIADRLNKGGFFYMVEFHPIVWMFDYAKEQPELRYPYLKGEVIYEEYEGTYTNSDATIVSKEYGWNHGLGEVVSALTNAGLEISFLHEFEASPYDCFPDMQRNKDGFFEFKKYKGLFPLLYSIKATKK